MYFIIYLMLSILGQVLLIHHHNQLVTQITFTISIVITIICLIVSQNIDYIDIILFRDINLLLHLEVDITQDHSNSNVCYYN